MAQDAAAAPGAAGRSLDSAHKALLERDDLQFVFNEAPRREARPTPDWLRDLFDAIGGLLSLPHEVVRVLFWAVIIAAVLGIVFLIARELGALDFSRRKASPPPPAPLYRPDADTAKALLADADALAAEGRYEEAVHVLLLRSVEDIGRWRPGAVEPSFTSRDLLTLAVLPAVARNAFSAMARLVEQSLFGGRPVGREGFEESRRAYAEFALPGAWT